MEKDFLRNIFELTLAGAVTGYILIRFMKDSFLGVIGAFLILGSLGGFFLLGFMVAVIVWYEVSELTFGLLGILAAAPFIVFPAWILWKLLGGRHRGYDGRGFEDGDGSN